MRFLPNARIVVLDGDPSHRAFLCAELTELGLVRVFPAATVKEARHLAAESPVDLCIVDPRRLDAKAGGKFPPNPLQESATLAILLAADTSAAALEIAAAAGYRAVIGFPIVPRVLYRRVGSILQKARRSSRTR
jgi:AmiR/NasT family two-component response regulator